MFFALPLGTGKTLLFLASPLGTCENLNISHIPAPFYGLQKFSRCPFFMDVENSPDAPFFMDSENSPPALRSDAVQIKK